MNLEALGLSYTKRIDILLVILCKWYAMTRVELRNSPTALYTEFGWALAGSAGTQNYDQFRYHPPDIHLDWRRPPYADYGR